MVTLGGVKRIGKVAEALVPFMCVTYIIAGVVVLVVNAAVIPDAVALIFSSAFNPVAATGGFAGSVVMMSIVMVWRVAFSLINWLRHSRYQLKLLAQLRVRYVQV